MRFFMYITWCLCVPANTDLAIVLLGSIPPSDISISEVNHYKYLLQTQFHLFSSLENTQTCKHWFLPQGPFKRYMLTLHLHWLATTSFWKPKEIFLVLILFNRTEIHKHIWILSLIKWSLQFTCKSTSIMWPLCPMYVFTFSHSKTS